MALFRSATTRIVAAHFALVAMSTAVVLGGVYWSTRSLIETELRQVVQAELTGLADSYRVSGLAGLVAAIERRSSPSGSRDGVYLLTGPTGRRLAGNLLRWPDRVAPGSGWVEIELYRTDEQRHAAVSAASLRLAGGERLLVGRDAGARTEFEERLIEALVWALAIMGALSLATGWLMSRAVLGRIGEVAATAETIVSGAMGRRVPLHGTGDEFDRLAAALNAMLDRIERLVGDLRMVTDSVAHDLRSPLTRLRGHVEAALSGDLDAPARETRLARALEEADHVLRTFTGLLEIARAEAGVGRDQFERLDLGALAEDMGELFQPVAEEAGLALALDTVSAPVEGHPQLLAQAVSNLLENAVAHAPEDSTLALTVTAGPAGPVLEVADRGPGVPEAERARILERFVRLDASRGGSGTGLGLSLVAAVARLHGARLTLNDNAPGLRVRIAFPAPPPEPDRDDAGDRPPP